MPVYSRDEVIAEISPDSAIGDAKIHRAFIAETSALAFLDRQKAKRIANAATSDIQMSDKELLCLLVIAQYQHCWPDAQRFLTKFINFASDLKNNLLFRGKAGVEALTLSDTEERKNIDALHKASQIRVGFILPDQKGYYYSFAFLKSVAHLLNHGFYEQFAYAYAPTDGYGLTANHHDFVAYSYDMTDFRKDYQRTSTVIHECIHVWQDAYNIRMDVGHAEVAAHLAQAIWILFHRRPLYGRLEQDAFSDLAEEMVDFLRGHGSVFRPVSDEEYADMRDVLREKYPELRETAFKNGVRFSAQLYR